MDNYNIRQDRPRLSSAEIAQQKDFDTLLNDHYIMKKPFYKSPWFFGVTGMASLGLLIGTSYSFTDRPVEPPLADVTAESAPENKLSETIHLASIASYDNQTGEAEAQKVKEIKIIELKKKNKDDNNATLIESENAETPKKIRAQAKETKNRALFAEQSAAPLNIMQNQPKLNGAFGGNLSQSTLSNKSVISTDSNIPIIGFEMHLKTEFGAKVLRSDSDKLTVEMVSAIKKVNADTEVFFEAIKGAVNSQKSVQLPPLKFNIVK